MKILVTGGSGLLGKAIQNVNNNRFDMIFINSKTCDLTNYNETLKVFGEIKPDYIIHCAANCGGLFKNIKEPVEIYEDNILINTNVLKAAHYCNVQNVLSILSTCIFPKQIKQYPLISNMMHDGEPHESNFAYAYSKRMLEIHSRAYNKQYNRNYVCVIPINIYGKFDNFNLENAHVIPALIHKAYLAKKNNTKLLVKGSGKALRQFIFSEDLANIILNCIQKNQTKNIIIANEKEITIKDIADIIAKKFQIEYEFDNIIINDGQQKKQAKNEYKDNFEFTKIQKGLQITIEWFQKNYKNIRK